jgi:hypothetical protein
MNYFIPARDKTRNFPVLSVHNLSEDYELNDIGKKEDTTLKFYIPFRELKSSNPKIKLSKRSENIKLKDIGSLNTIIFIEDSYKKDNKSLDPSPIMKLDTALVVNEKIKNFIKERDPTINYEQACYIKSEDEFIGDYWIIRPNTKQSIIDLEESKFDLDVIDEEMPSLNMYYFDKIIVKKDIELKTILFTEPYLRRLVITEEFLRFLQKNRLNGLSFLEIEKYETWKTVEKHEDHIII